MKAMIKEVLKKITKLEVIVPNNGREFVLYLKENEKVEYSLQDDQRTLKIFITDKNEKMGNR